MFALAGISVRTTLKDSLINGYISLSNLLSSLVRKVAFVFGYILHLCTWVSLLLRIVDVSATSAEGITDKSSFAHAAAVAAA